jgi:prepilin-type N-terminal cleavage/methylation domain-containing protein
MGRIITMKKNKSAMTIIELMIAIFLFSILLSATGIICVQVMKIFNRSRYKLAVQQEAKLSIDRLCRELKESYLPGVNIMKSYWNSKDPNDLWDAISFPTSRDSYDASGSTSMYEGKLRWPRYVVYFKGSGKKELYRRVISVTGHPKSDLYPDALPDIKLIDFLTPAYPLNCPPSYTVPSGTISNDRKIARDIYNIEFDIYNPSTIYYGLPIVHITVDTRIKTGTDSDGNDIVERTVLTTDVKPENF